MRRYKLILILKYYILIIPCCYFKRIFFNNYNIYNFNKLWFCYRLCWIYKENNEVNVA